MIEPYRMLIADDEDDERAGIRFLLRQQGLSLSVTEAQNGRTAWELLKEKPFDILMTDVRMPFLDGIELATRARTQYPGLQIVFISGYDDFEYLRTALALQAVDYILKPVVAEEFQKTLVSLLSRVDVRRSERERRERESDERKNHILYRLLNRTSLHTLRAEYPDDELPASYSRLFLLELENFFDNQPNAVEHIQALSANLGCPCDFLNLNPSQGVLLFREEASDEVFRQLAWRLRERIAEVCGCTCYLSISGPIDSAAQISDAYVQAEKFLEDRFFYPDAGVFPASNEVSGDESVFISDDALLQAIQVSIEKHDSAALRRDVDRLFRTHEKKQDSSYIYTCYTFSNLLRLLRQGLHREQDDLVTEVEAIYSCATLSEIRMILEQVLEQQLRIFDRERQSPKYAVQLVRQYIYTHYSEELSLGLLAEKAFLTPHYLSSVFTQETGYGINRFIKNVRMKKARELLSATNMKITDICRAVGYSNTSYFCQSFREEFGSPPEKFRQQL